MCINRKFKALEKDITRFRFINDSVVSKNRKEKNVRNNPSLKTKEEGLRV